ncbi:MAG: M48 family metallopeptidase [Bacteroidota bacterium]
MKKNNFLFLFFLIQVCSVSQNSAWFHYKWDSMPGINQEVFDNAADFYKTYYKNNIYVGVLDEKSAKTEASGFYADYKSGNIYPYFFGYEKYIKEILKEVITDTLMVNKLSIYFYHDAGFNASMDALGNMRINVGMFNYIHNEAELAGVLAHEYAHFFNKDALQKGSFESFLEFLPYYDYSYYSKNQENAADFMAVNYLKNSGYSTKGISNVFKIFKRFEIKAELLYGNNRAGSYTHPDPGDRIKQLRILAKDSINVGKKLFLVDSIKFMNLKKMAGQEAFNIMVENRKYNDIIELSFTKHLYAPTDQENLALLTEGIRRFLKDNPKQKEKQFIIEQYKGRGSKRSDNYKYVDDATTSVLKYLNKGLLHLPSLDLSKVRAVDLLDSINLKFTTYDQAFTYFMQKGLDADCKPCAISTLLNSGSNNQNATQVLEKNTVFNCSDYIKHLESKTNYVENIYILNLPSINHLKYFESEIGESYSDFTKNYLELFKNTTGLANVYLTIDLPFADQHKINSLSSISEGIINKFLFEKIFYSSGTDPYPYPFELKKKENYAKKETLEWGNYSPELFSVFSKHKAKNIYIIDFYTIKLTQSFKVNRIGWRFRKISLDPNVPNVTYEHKILNSKEPHEAVIKDGASLFKFFLSANK